MTNINMEDIVNNAINKAVGNAIDQAIGENEDLKGKKRAEKFDINPIVEAVKEYRSDRLKVIEEEIEKEKSKEQNVLSPESELEQEKRLLNNAAYLQLWVKKVLVAGSILKEEKDSVILNDKGISTILPQYHKSRGKLYNESEKEIFFEIVNNGRDKEGIFYEIEQEKQKKELNHEVFQEVKEVKEGKIVTGDHVDIDKIGLTNAVLQNVHLTGKVTAEKLSQVKNVLKLAIPKENESLPTGAAQVTGVSEEVLKEAKQLKLKALANDGLKAFGVKLDKQRDIQDYFYNDRKDSISTFGYTEFGKKHSNLKEQSSHFQEATKKIDNNLYVIYQRLNAYNEAVGKDASTPLVGMDNLQKVIDLTQKSMEQMEKASTGKGLIGFIDRRVALRKAAEFADLAGQYIEKSGLGSLPNDKPLVEGKKPGLLARVKYWFTGKAPETKLGTEEEEALNTFTKVSDTKTVNQVDEKFIAEKLSTVPDLSPGVREKLAILQVGDESFKPKDEKQAAIVNDRRQPSMAEFRKKFEERKEKIEKIQDPNQKEQELKAWNKDLQEAKDFLKDVKEQFNKKQASATQNVGKNEKVASNSLPKSQDDNERTL